MKLITQVINFPKQLNISNNDKIEITFNSNPEMNININHHIIIIFLNLVILKLNYQNGF